MTDPRLTLLVLALTAALTFAVAASARRPPNCGQLEPRGELSCAKRQLHHAKYRLHHPGRTHSPGYWHWRIKVSHRWIFQAHRRLARVLPLTNDWQTAVRIAQRTWPGTAAWMLSCSKHEGGWGGFVMNSQGSGAGGWLQYMEGTFWSHYSHAVTLARQRHLPVPPAGLGWTSPLAHAFAGGWGYHYNRSAWAGDSWC